MFDIIDTIFLIIILAISIGLHEYAHAITSFRLGDPTPKLQNRLTPNPLAHIDPIGFLMIFLVHFGWGKPVMVNPSYYKNRLRDELIVSLAGPFTNLMLAIIGIIIVLVYAKFLGGYTSPMMIKTDGPDLLIRFWINFSWINVALAIFNLLPVPPLDGYRLIKFFWPKLGMKMERNQLSFFIMLILFLFLFGGMISQVTSFILEKFSRLIALIVY